VPDQHWNEHATCFRLGDRGLVVLSSCGHAGIINTLRRAQEITGIERIYALVGGLRFASECLAQFSDDLAPHPWACSSHTAFQYVNSIALSNSSRIASNSNWRLSSDRIASGQLGEEGCLWQSCRKCRSLPEFVSQFFFGGLGAR
jgi:hypothetical protein